MNKRSSRLLTVAALVVVITLAAFVGLAPAQATSTHAPSSSEGCLYFHEAAVFGPSSAGSGFHDFRAGETIYIYVTGSNLMTEAFLEIDNTEVSRITDDGTLSYTFTTSGNYDYSFGTSPTNNNLFWDFNCPTAGAAPASNPAPVGGTLAEPFFQNSLPAQGIHLDIARETPYMGQLPIDVFEPHWWGVKSLNAARFPKLAGMDLTTVEVLCMDSAGNWSGEWVTEYRVTETVHEVLIKQHGICAIFPK